MSATPIVSVICDPFGICSVQGDVVDSSAKEKEAIAHIDQVLTRDARYETVVHKTYIVQRPFVSHFRTYRRMRGVSVIDLTPSSRLGDLLGIATPPWLSDLDICDWDLLRCAKPESVSSGDWPRAVATWLFPGVEDVSSIGEWLSVVASASELPAGFVRNEARAWLDDQFHRIARASLPSTDTARFLSTSLQESESPVDFALAWLRRTATLPILRPDRRNPLNMPDSARESPQDLAAADDLQVVYPLPEPLRDEVERIFQRAVRYARSHHSDCFEEAVTRLNAIWGGVPEELESWLEMHPGAMTRKAAEYFARLPGFQKSETARRLIRDFAPPEDVPVWSGLNAQFESWTSAYARYMGKCFVRRQLPRADADPAEPFSAWLKDNYEVAYKHPEFGYPSVSSTIRGALANTRQVILVVLDALAIHCVEEAIAHLADSLGSQPTRSTFAFTALPTITEVCKQSVITGCYPQHRSRELLSAVSSAYGLEDEDIQIASHWKDAQRLQVKTRARLIIYLDNRLDELLTSLSDYRIFLEDSRAILTRISRLVGRWARDMQGANPAMPLVVLTADHGFTFGPPTAQNMAGSRAHDSGKRCFAVGSGCEGHVTAGDGFTAVEASKFHLRQDYIVARGRGPCRDTMSGWVLSHGGSLPEEVIIPVVEWFGDETSRLWPDVSFPDSASRDRESWFLRVLLRNNHNSRIPAGTLIGHVLGEETGDRREFRAMDPGQESTCDLRLSGAETLVSDKLAVDITLETKKAERDGDRRNERYDIPVVQHLVDRTTAQDAFEDMF